MPSKADCIDSAMKAGVSRTEARDIVDELLKRKRNLAADGQLDRAELALARAWTQKAKAARIRSAEMRRHAALNIVRRKELDGFINEVKAGGHTFLDALEARMGGSAKHFQGARDSVTRRRWAIEGRLLGSMLNDLGELDGALPLLRDDPTFHADVVREMMEPGTTHSELARDVAKVFADHAEAARLRLNSAGAMIGKLDGWTPQTHDPIKLQASDLGGKEGWVDFTAARLDAERSFPDKSPEEVREILGEVYETIVSGRDRGLSAAEKGQFVGPRNLARGMGKQRVLHFRDADAFLQYHERYGHGNVLTNMDRHLSISARKASLMEVFGPNPESMILSLLDAEKRAIRINPDLDAPAKAKAIARLNKAWSPGKVISGRLAHLFAELNGETFGAVRPTAANIAAGVRNVQAMAKLGGATLSAFADVFVKMAQGRVHGMSLLESARRAMDMRFEHFTPPEQQRIFRSLGTMIDGTLQPLLSRWNAQDSVRGYAGLLMDKFFRWSGLTGWTEAHKAGWARALSIRLGDVRESAWAALPDDTRALLGWHGFDSQKWEAVRAMATKEADGNWHVLPESAKALPDAVVDPLIADRLARIEATGGTAEAKALASGRARDEVRRELETLVGGYYADELRFAIVEPDDKTRATMVRGTRPGTVEGEALRFVMQFKSFPIAYYQRVLKGRRWGRAGQEWDMLGLATFAASAMLFGYVSMTAKDLSRGKTPRDPSKPQTWAAAAAQSGGAGIFGDFLFGKVNRFGGGFLSTIAGPTLSSASAVGVGLQDILFGDPGGGGETIFREMLSTTPFINMWYARALQDYLFGFHVREMMSPGTIKRSERRMRREYGQAYWLPVEHIKRGGGFK